MNDRVPYVFLSFFVCLVVEDAIVHGLQYMGFVTMAPLKSFIQAGDPVADLSTRSSSVLGDAFIFLGGSVIMLVSVCAFLGTTFLSGVCRSFNADVPDRWFAVPTC